MWETDPKVKKAPRLIYTSYLYRGANGAPLFEVVKRPHQPTGWDRFYGVGHTRRFEPSLVYRLPELIRAC